MLSALMGWAGIVGMMVPSIKVIFIFNKKMLSVISRSLALFA